MMETIETFPGRILAAARVAAGLGVRELCAAASVSRDTITRLEAMDVIHISPKQRHGCVSRETWGRIVGALAEKGVELTQRGVDHREGLRLKLAPTRI